MAPSWGKQPPTFTPSNPIPTISAIVATQIAAQPAPAADQETSARLDEIEERLEALEALHPSPTMPPESWPMVLSEYGTIQSAVASMMVDSSISSLPNPNTFGDAGGCTAGTNKMGEFPDFESDSDTVGGDGGKITDPNGNAYDTTTGDKEGFILYQHDIIRDGVATGLVNYVSSSTAGYCYASAADGTITQYDKTGTQLNP